MSSPLKRRAVLITGGTRGIGLAISRAFLAAGADVLAVSRRAPEALPATRDAQARWFAADLRDPDQVADAVQAAKTAFGRLDVLVNNAGGSPWAEAASASPRFHEKIIALNLLAPLHCAQAANRIMQGQATGGVIINIASVSGTRPSPGTAAYGAAKAGLLNLTQSLAVEWAPRVRVVAITAGLIRTEQSHLHYGDEAGIARVAATVPLGRLGAPEDIASACVWLAGDGAAYVSGASLTLHGGGEWPAFLKASQGG